MSDQSTDMFMTKPSAKFDAAARRQAAKRTALVAGLVAIAIYALAIVEAVFRK